VPEIRPGVRRLFRLPARRPADAAAEVDDEIRLHLELRAEQLVARGLAPADARAEAERRFGPLDEARARLRTSARRRDGRARFRDAADALGRDLRLAGRALRRAPGFAAVAVLTLALGVGANTAVFSLLNAVALRALPVRDPGALVVLGRNADEAGTFTNPIWEAVRDRQTVFDGVFAYTEARLNLADAGEERRVLALAVSGDFFTALGVGAALGRPLARGDDVRGCPAVAAVSHRFWRQSLGGDPAAVGRSLRLEGRPVQVVGVVDPRFAGIEAGRDVQVYTPLCADAVLAGARSFLDARSTWTLRIVGRPRAGLTLAGVNAGLAAIAPAVHVATVPADWPAEMRSRYLRDALVAVPSLATLSGLRVAYTRPLAVLLAIAGLVLLVACANVANLVLARGAGRARELAVRVALGGGRARLVRQLFVEGLVLAGAGAALGLVVAFGGGRLLVALLSTSQDAVRLDLAPDLRVLGFTAALAVATAVLFSLAPAWPATRVDPRAALQASGRGVVGRPARFGAGRLLVAGQIALSLVLVSAAALLLGSFRALATADPGFRAVGVARDAKYTSLRDGAPPTAFVALDRDSTFGSELTFVVRGAGAPERLAAGVRRVFRDAAPRATLRLAPVGRQVAESLTRDRLLATLSAFFGALALLLAALRDD